MKITVQPGRNIDLSLLSIGDIVTFEKRSDSISSTYIKAYHNGEDIGFVADTPTQLIPGSDTASNVYDELPDKFEGVVKSSQAKITSKKKVCLLVEVAYGSKSTKSSSTAEEQTFLFKVSGSTGVNPAKTSVIAEVKKGEKTFVVFELIKDKIVAFYNGIQAGTVSERTESGNASAEERETFKEILSSKDDKDVIEGKVQSITAGSYTVQVAVSSTIVETAKTTATKKVMGSIKDPLIDKGFDEETLNNVETYLLDNGFNVADISAIFDSYKIYPPTVQHLIPKNPTRLFNDKNKDMLYDSFSAIAEDCHIICSGEKGTGKNVFIDTWAWILQRPLYAISINRETDKTDLLGSKTIEPVKVVDENTGEETYVSKIIFQKEVLLEAMEVGGIINIDEINFADPGVTGLLHSVGDDRKQIFVPGYGLVKGDKNFIMMATMNVGYQGTMDLNEALADRFVDIVFENNDSIADILESNCPGVPKSSIAQCDKIYGKIVGALRDADATLDDSCVTVRGFIQALKMSKRIDLKKALIRGVADKIKDNDYRQNVIDIIETVVH